NQPRGSFDADDRSALLDANGRIRSIDEYRDLVVSWREGAPLRLGDIAMVENGAEDRFLAAWANKQPAVLINIQRQPGANVIDVADSIEELMPKLRATMPAAANITVLSDRTH